MSNNVLKGSIHQAKSFASDPAVTDLGAIYFNTTSNTLKYYNGTSWVNASSSVISVNGYTGVVVLTKSDVGLSNVDNTSDISKPVSTAQNLADIAVQSFSVQRANHTGTQLAATISDFNTAAAAAAPVQSVNSLTGAVSLTTTNIPQGTNLYFTVAAAKSAAVANSITSGVTDVAPSQDAVFQALATKANDSAVVHLSGTETITGYKTFNAGLRSNEEILVDSSANPYASLRSLSVGLGDSKLIMISSGDALAGNSGNSSITTGNATQTVSTVVFQGINYQSDTIGAYANNYSVQNIIDASLSLKTSGTLTVDGQTVYVIVNYVAGDNFTNVGGANVTGSVFLPTGSTPSVWTNLSSLQPIVIASTSFRLLNRISASITRDQLLAAVLATYSSSHSLIATTAGGTNVTQTAGTGLMNNAQKVGDVSLGSDNSGQIIMHQPYIVFDSKDQFNQTLLMGKYANSSSATQDLGLMTGQNGGTGDTGTLFLRSGDNDGSGRSGNLNMRTGVVRGSLASGNVILGTGNNQVISTANTGSMTIRTGGVFGLGGNTGQVSITSGTIQSTALATSISGAFNWSTGAINVSGSTVNTGAINLNSGNNLSTSSGGTGAVAIQSGALTGTGSGTTGSAGISTGTKAGGSTGATGLAYLTTGGHSGTGNTGLVFISTGNASNGTSGSTILQTGNGTAGSGVLILQTGVASSGTTGGVNVNSGNAAGTGSTGTLFVKSGDHSGTSGNTGFALFSTGDMSGANIGGTTGTNTLRSGNVTNAAATASSGFVAFVSGDNSGGGNTGSVTIRSGQILNSGTGNTGSAFYGTGAVNNGNGSSGSVNINSGQTLNGGSGATIISTGLITGTATVTTGQLTISTGGMTNGSATASTGIIQLFSGNVSAGSGQSGTISLASGNTTNGASGQVFLNSGNVSGTGDSGNITIAVGTVQANHNSGNITFNTASTSGTGTGGNISINANSIGSNVSINGSGLGSTINLNANTANGVVSIQANGINGTIQLLAANNINMNAPQMIVSSGYQISFFNTANTQSTILKAQPSATSSATFYLPQADGTNGQVLQTNGSGVLGFATPSSGGWTTLIKAFADNGFTASNNQEIFANTSGGAFVINLPASPTSGQRVRLVDYSGTWATNNLTAGRSGSNIQGSATDYILNTNNIWVEFVYVDSTRGWNVLL
jgi:hypothetical protein